jgi:transposase
MMKGEEYKEVLVDHLVPFMELHKVKTFMQDGAPCHASKLVIESLKKEKFTVLEWPGNSPDFNPIENCWSFMKKKLKEDHTITSLPKLIEAIKRMWVRDIPKEYFQKLSASRPRRLQMVLDQMGEMTKH